jgi:hypothetical protein
MLVNWLVTLAIVLCAFSAPGFADDDGHEETAKTSHLEEFTAYNPMEFHNLAMNAFMELRRKDPTVNLSTDGEFMQRGTAHAVRRGRRRPEEALTLRVSIR